MAGVFPGKAQSRFRLDADTPRPAGVLGSHRMPVFVSS